MPSKFGGVAVEEAPKSKFGGIPVKEEKPGALARLGHGLYETTVGPILNTVKDLPGAAAGVFNVPKLEEIAKHIKEGNYGQAALAVGQYATDNPAKRAGDQMVGDVAHDVKEGNLAGAGGRIIGDSLMMAGPELVARGAGALRGAAGTARDIVRTDAVRGAAVDAGTEALKEIPGVKTSLKIKKVIDAVVDELAAKKAAAAQTATPPAPPPAPVPPPTGFTNSPPTTTLSPQALRPGPAMQQFQALRARMPQAAPETAPPVGPPAVEAPPPEVEPQPKAPIPIDIARQLRETMKEGGTQVDPPAEPGEVNPFKAKAQAKKVDTLAGALEDAGQGYSRMSQLTGPELTATVQAAAKLLELNEFSPESIGAVMAKLKEVETAKAAKPTAMQEFQAIKAKMPKGKTK